MEKTVIIGAGLAGLSAAYHMCEQNRAYEIYEARDAVGGLCATIEKDGFLFDYSGHLLHLKEPFFQELVRDLLGDNLNILTRDAAIFSNGVYTRYPFQANLFGLPAQVVKECLLEFTKAYYGNEELPTNNYRTFRDWIVANLGDGIGKHFMFPYNEKLWTVPTESMTCEWLGDYVPKPSIDDVFNGAFEDQAKGLGYNATFWYPKRGGIQTLCNALAERVASIHLNEEALEIDQQKKSVRFSSGNIVPYGRLISTMPLLKLMNILSCPLTDEVFQAVHALRHNSVLIVNLGVKGTNLTGRHWIYLPEKKYIAYRVGVYSNISPAMAPPGTTSYYVEIAYQKNMDFDREHAVAKATEDMLAIGLVRSLDDILVKEVVEVDCAYVIYDDHYAESRRVILEYLAAHDIRSIGRYGNWEYSGMEEAMMQGKDTANSNAISESDGVR